MTKKPDYQITAAIVLYNNNRTMLWKAIESFLATSIQVHILLVDNSPTDTLSNIADQDNRISYIFNNANLGFGAAHNIAIKRLATRSKYHIILNPDVYFSGEVLTSMYNYMEANPDIGILCPKVLYPDSSIQYLCRKLPTPFDLFLKRVIPVSIQPLFKKRLDAYEFKDRNYDEIMNVPSLSGCFMFVRHEVFERLGGFDENIFMYMEDFDFTRRTSKFYKTVYYPLAIVFHHYARESTTNKKLLYIAIRSTVYYFNKWGWFFDKERKKLNA